MRDEGFPPSRPKTQELKACASGSFANPAKWCAISDSNREPLRFERSAILPIVLMARNGSPGEIRTLNLLVLSQTQCCQLCYGAVVSMAGFEPAFTSTSSWRRCQLAYIDMVGEAGVEPAVFSPKGCEIYSLGPSPLSHPPKQNSAIKDHGGEPEIRTRNRPVFLRTNARLADGCCTS